MRAIFFSRTGNTAIADRITQSGCTLAAPPGFASMADDARATLEFAHAHRADWVVVDGYGFDTPYLDTLVAGELRLTVIDDLAALERYPAAVLLNQNIDAEQLNYRTGPECRLLLGPAYAMLRPEFAAWNAWCRPPAEIAKHVLVTLGGGDASEAEARVLTGLTALARPLEIRVLRGSLAGQASSIDAAVEVARSAGHAVSLRPHAADMPSEMAWADMAIAGGGSTVWELAYMQTPALLLLLAENQRANVEGLTRAGAAINLGAGSRITIPELARTAQAVLDHRRRREGMAQAGRRLVDGQGASRVARAIRELSE
jgi:spore coat polysaccharide biosynthesis predicted glycosyltransferase SpsG